MKSHLMEGDGRRPGLVGARGGARESESILPAAIVQGARQRPSNPILPSAQEVM